MLPRDNPVPAKRRVDYRPPAFLVDTLGLEFDLAPDATRVRADIAFRRNPGAGADGAGGAAGARWRAAGRRAGGTGRPTAACDAARVRRRHADGARPAGGRHAHRPLAHRPGPQRRARRAVRVVRRLLHAVRAGGIPPDHLLSRPARRARALHGDDTRRSRRLSGAAVERQPRRAGCARRQPALRDLVRPAPEALLSLRAGGRRPRRPRGHVHDDVRPYAWRCASIRRRRTCRAAGMRWSR